MPDDHVVAKLDFSTTFNSLQRDSMLQEIFDYIPELIQVLPFVAQQSLLSFGRFTISSQEGAQHGDPLGTLLICLTVNPIICSLSSPLFISYMDDFTLTLGGLSRMIAQDVKLLSKKGVEGGLQLNAENVKAFIHHPSLNVFHSFTRVEVENCMILGAPLWSPFTGYGN